MFHHRSCGTAELVALLAAHRLASRDAALLRQQDVAWMLHRLDAQPLQEGEAVVTATDHASRRGVAPS